MSREEKNKQISNFIHEIELDLLMKGVGPEDVLVYEIEALLQKKLKELDTSQRGESKLNKRKPGQKGLKKSKNADA